MGFRYWKDGVCHVCGHHTEHFCDVCKKWICEGSHTINAKIKGKDMELCPDCAKKAKII